MADGYLNFDVNVEKSNFEKATKSIENTVSKLGKTLAKFLSLTALVAFSKQAVETASDVQEVQNVVDTAFGDMAYKMENFADIAIETYGISKLTAKQTGSTFASMGVGMGLAQDSATDMAVALTGLSADMASFYNVSQDIASTALKSVFTGETETLKQFGIVMTQTNLEAYALSQGITKSYSAMTEAEKVMLRYGYVMQSTSLAQGDFAKTSSGWANQTRILQEKFKELSSTIGNVILNVALPAVNALNNALTHLVNYASNVAKALSEMFGWETRSAESIKNATDKTADNYADMSQSATQTANENERSLAGFDKINKLSSSNSSSSSTTVSDGSTGLLTNANNTATVTVTIDADTTKITAKLKAIQELIKPLTQRFGEGFEWFYKNVLSPLGSWAGNDLVPAFLGAVKNAVSGLDSVWQTAKPVLQESLWEGFLKPIASFTADMAVTSITMLGDAIKGLGESLDESDISFLVMTFKTIAEIFVGTKIIGGISTIATAVDGLIVKLTILGVSIQSTLGAGFVGSFNQIGILIATAIAAWNFGSWLYDTFEEEINSALYPLFDDIVFLLSDFKENMKILLSGFVDWWKNLVTGCVDWWKNFVTNAKNSMWNVIKDFGNSMLSFFESLWTGLKNIFSPVVTFFKPLFANAWNGIKSAWSGVKTWFSNLWGGIKSVFSGIKTWFTNLFSNAWNGIKGVFNGVYTFFDWVVDKIKEPFKNIGNWFSTTFRTAWSNVKNVFSKGGQIFSDIKDGVLNGLKNIINGLIGGINTVIKIPFDGINTALKKIRDISIFDYQPFKDKIKTISVPQIPQLATGAVIPPNREFLAVLGDQKSGTNIETPLSTMIEAFETALRRNNYGDSTPLVVNVDGQTLFKIIVDKNRKNTIRTGKNALA